MIPLAICASLALTAGAYRRDAYRDLEGEQDGDAIDLCLPRAGADREFLEEIVTTSRGQKWSTFEQHFERAQFRHPGDSGIWQYHFPEEALIVCHRGAKTLGEVRTHKGHRPLLESELQDLFGTLEAVFIASDRRQIKTEMNNFVVSVDIDGNLIVAPIWQGDPPYEVKHGDLTPGQTPLGRGVRQTGAWNDDVVGDHAGGAFRGPARFGGEFNMVPGTGREWVLHQRSGYSLRRLPREAILDFMQNHLELTDDEVWQVLRDPDMTEAPDLGVDALERLRCYMQGLGVPVIVPDYNKCEMGSAAEAPKLQGFRPVLEKCAVVTTQKMCSHLDGNDLPKLHLVEWVPQGAKRCGMTVDGMTDALEAVDKMWDQNQNGYDNLRTRLQWLKNSPCWSDDQLTAEVRPGCLLQSAVDQKSMRTLFGEMRRIGNPNTDMEVLHSQWDGILDYWNSRCRSTTKTSVQQGSTKTSTSQGLRLLTRTD